jgi:hypothetical protein
MSGTATTQLGNGMIHPQVCSAHMIELVVVVTARLHAHPQSSGVTKVCPGTPTHGLPPPQQLRTRSQSTRAPPPDRRTQQQALTNQVPANDVTCRVDACFDAPRLRASRPAPTSTEPNTSLDGSTLHRYAIVRARTRSLCRRRSVALFGIGHNPLHRSGLVGGGLTTARARGPVDVDGPSLRRRYSVMRWDCPGGGATWVHLGGDRIRLVFHSDVISAELRRILDHADGGSRRTSLRASPNASRPVAWALVRT